MFINTLTEACSHRFYLENFVAIQHTWISFDRSPKVSVDVKIIIFRFISGAQTVVFVIMPYNVLHNI